MSYVNPEEHWATAEDGTEEAAAVEERLGAPASRAERLRGGRANLNVRIGEERVLRIYQRDRSAAAKEAALLRRGWTSFVVPRVLGSGDDFLILEFIPHRRLAYTIHDAADLGRALAEIHATPFPVSGFLDGELTIARPFGDVVVALEQHASSELEGAALPRSNPLMRDVQDLVRRKAEGLRTLSGSPVLLHGDFKASSLRRTLEGDRLLVFDWEFAWSGPALMDVGQLFRWGAPPKFAARFEESYRNGGGTLAEGWLRWAEIFDLFNLAGLLRGGAPASRQFADVERRILETLARHPR